MKKEHIFLVFVLLVTALSFYYLYQVLAPFLAPILWAILLAIVFYPLFLKLQLFLKNKRVLSALAMTLFVVVVIVLPATFLMISLADEVIDFYHHLEEMIKTGRLQSHLNRVGELPLLRGALERLKQHVDVSQADPLPFFLKNVRQISAFLFNQTSNLKVHLYLCRRLLLHASLPLLPLQRWRSPPEKS